ncbi:MAG: ABC transporter permease [Candidatus Bipolaricaulis sp.]|nr:ABC transporter permease [Candidatus Bipolaricaulis sp.]MDD5219199.1 ABC transporter permease [Candidatus Bipolaricaulis sp.]MDD5646764.1 ABC transporter permease [Candidatus Bipolaricaulis sp.]
MKGFWKKLGRWIAVRPLAAAGMATLLAILLLALLAPVLPLQDPQSVSMHDKLLSPSAVHPMGTDDLGRDMLSRVVHGARTSLLVSVIVVACASVFGMLVGLAAGYFGGIVDELMMRTTDIFLAFPALMLAMAVAVVLGPGVVPTIVALSVVWWPWYARLARSEALMYKQADFVEAARAVGVPTWRILRAHILPNSLSPLIVQATLDMGYAILTTASLSFIGLGVQEPTAEWGAMLNIGRKYLLSSWWFITFPGLAIFITVLAINLAGDGIRDYLDPRTRKRGA